MHTVHVVKELRQRAWTMGPTEERVHVPLPGPYSLSPPPLRAFLCVPLSRPAANQTSQTKS
jgi:hypothetical protein